MRTLSQKWFKTLRDKILPLAAVAALVTAQAYLSPTYVQAAPGVGNATSGFVNSSTPPTINYNAGTGSDRMLIVIVGVDDAIKKVNTVTYGGVAMTEAVRKVNGTAGVQIFYLLNPSSGSNTVSMSTSGSDNYVYLVARVTGAGSVSATTGNESGSSARPGVSKTADAADSIIVAAFGSDNTATTFSPFGGSTEVAENTATGIRAGMYTKNASSAGSAVRVEANAGNNVWAAAAIEIKAPVVLPTVSLSIDSDEVEEGELANFEIRRTGATTGSLAVNYEADPSEGASPDDYTFITSGSCTNESNERATIPSGMSSCTVVLQIEEDEETGESGESLTIDLNNSAQYLIDGEDNNVTISMLDTTEGGDEGGLGGYAVGSPGFWSMSLFDNDAISGGSIVGFEPSPLRVRSGSSAQLSYNLSGLDTYTCSINNGVGAVPSGDGLHTVTTPPITANTTFVLTCTNGSDVKARSTSVGIVPVFIEQ